MNKFTYINHDTFAEDRNNGIGASDIAILCGASNYKTPLELWQNKTGKETEVISDDLQKLFDAGHEQEPVTLWRYLKSVNDEKANEIFEYHLNNDPYVSNNIKLFTRFQHNEFMFAHPDMIYNNINIEAKFVKYRGEWDFHDLTENGVPFKIYLQVQYQMMCSGLKETIVCANYQGAENYYFPIKANKELYPKFEKICTDFWGLVKRNEPPMPQSRNDIKKLFPNRNFKSIMIPEDLEMETVMLKDRYSILKQRIGGMKKEQEKIKSSVMALMTQNNVLQTNEGEQIAKITTSSSEKIKALSIIKKEHTRIYKYLVRNKMIEEKSTDRFYF